MLDGLVDSLDSVELLAAWFSGSGFRFSVFGGWGRGDLRFEI